MDIINPSTGEVYATSPNSGDADVDQAFQAAGRAFESGGGPHRGSARAPC